MVLFSQPVCLQNNVPRRDDLLWSNAEMIKPKKKDDLSYSLRASHIRDVVVEMWYRERLAGMSGYHSARFTHLQSTRSRTLIPLAVLFFFTLFSSITYMQLADSRDEEI